MVCVSARKVTLGQVGFLGFFFIFLLVFSGCSRALNSTTRRNVNASELYRDSAFGREHLERAGVTCLAARLSFGDETYGRALVQGMVETLHTHLSGRGIVHPNLAASHINEAGLAEDYAKMLAAYDETNILDRKTLRKITAAVRVRYFVVPILVNFQEGGSTRLSVFGVRLARTAWANARFQLQIWDGQSGRIVWEGMSDLTLAQELLGEQPVRFENIIAATWESIVEKIPSNSVAPAQADEPA